MVYQIADFGNDTKQDHIPFFVEQQEHLDKFLTRNLEEKLSPFFQKGWDGYDASAITHKAWLSALSIIRILGSLLPSHVFIYDLGGIAGNDGSIGLEWNNIRGIIYIDVEYDGETHGYYETKNLGPQEDVFYGVENPAKGVVDFLTPAFFEMYKKREEYFFGLPQDFEEDQSPSYIITNDTDYKQNIFEVSF